MNDDEWFPLAELTERVGALVWVEEQLAEILQRWSTIEPVSSAAIAFATAGGHHTWHSQVLRGCLPTSPLLNEIEAVRPPTHGWATSVDMLSGLVTPDATAARLRSIVKVIDPWIAREIGALAELSRPVSDAPLLRWLRFVTIDHLDDGAALSQVLAASANDTVRVDDHRFVTTLTASIGP